jgi:hypothetical protein
VGRAIVFLTVDFTMENPHDQVDVLLHTRRCMAPPATSPRQSFRERGHDLWNRFPERDQGAKAPRHGQAGECEGLRAGRTPNLS